MEKHDIIVIGSGISGLSTSYHLKLENPGLDILIVDKAKSYCQGNTGRSAAGFRDLFSSRINHLLSSSSISFYKHVQDELHHELGMKFVGYLFLAANNDRGRTLEDSVKYIPGTRRIELDQLHKSLSISELDKESADMLSLDPVEFGIFGANCGIIEPDLICDFYYNSLKEMGVNFSFGTYVQKLALDPKKILDFPGEPFLWQDKLIGPLETTGGQISADKYVIATDAWSNSLLDPIGVDSHQRPKKRQIFQISGPSVEKLLFTDSFSGYGIIPFTILPSHGIYLRPAIKERSLWIGASDDIGRDFSFIEDPEAEQEFYESSVYPVLTAYFPQLKDSKVTSKWAGYYSYNTIDKNPYIFRTMNAIVVTGTSGSGILKGDAIGRIASALAQGKDSASLYTDEQINVNDLGVIGRNVSPEHIIL
jgi:FAD-dependent oxidoreductase domain-containing protein 1